MLITILKTSAPNDPKMTLNATRSKMPLICFTSAFESYVLVRFTLQRAIFELTASLRHALNDPQITFNTSSMEPDML